MDLYSWTKSDNTYFEFISYQIIMFVVIFLLFGIF